MSALVERLHSARAADSSVAAYAAEDSRRFIRQHWWGHVCAIRRGWKRPRRCLRQMSAIGTTQTCRHVRDEVCSAGLSGWPAELRGRAARDPEGTWARAVC